MHFCSSKPKGCVAVVFLGWPLDKLLGRNSAFLVDFVFGFEDFVPSANCEIHSDLKHPAFEIRLKTE